MSWNLITHFTPERAIVSSTTSTVRPMPLMAHVLSQPTRLANDSAKPMQYIDVATACKEKTKFLALIKSRVHLEQKIVQ